MQSSSSRARWRALLAGALCASALAALPAVAQAASQGIVPKVMTRNLYLGADLTPALAALGCAPAPYCTLDADQLIWNAVVATDFPARAKLLAKEIDDDDPYVVGLQEVALWRSGPFNGVKDATTVEYDFLASLMSELAARGTHYAVAVQQQEADIENPSGSVSLGYADVRDRRLTMRDVILVRTDLPSYLLSFTNPQSGNYDASRVINIPTGSTYGPIEFKRGWTSIDAKILGHSAARIVNTHLESASSGYRQLQAAELVGAYGSGPLLTTLPSIIVGDLNSDSAITYGGNPASGVSDGAALAIIQSAGFVDSGNTVNTFGHAGNLLDFPSNVFTERIDHVLTRPGVVKLLTNKVVGTDPANRTPGGLWPSDHGGLVVGIGF